MRVAESVKIDPVAKAVGQRVKAVMDRQSIRQRAVAIRLRMSQGAVSRRITGTVPFNVAELERLARLFDVPASTFLSDDEEEAAA